MTERIAVVETEVIWYTIDGSPVAFYMSICDNSVRNVVTIEHVEFTGKTIKDVTVQSCDYMRTVRPDCTGYTDSAIYYITRDNKIIQ